MNKSITSRDNPVIKHTARLVADKALRREEGLFVCEGAVMLEEALRSGAAVRRVFFREGLEYDLPEYIEAYVVPQTLLERMSDVKTPQGIIFTVEARDMTGPLTGRHLLCCENLRDPGNMGTIMRTAEALGMDGVVLAGDCVDPLAPKTVRSSMGSVFRLPVWRKSLSQLSAELAELGLPLWGAALHRDAKDARTVDFSKAAVLIGNEARGLSEEAISACDGLTILPITGAESLNASVAAALFMWEMAKTN